MDIKQLALQLGIAGLLVLVGYRVALVFIERWGKSEDKRTDAMAAGFASLVVEIRDTREAVTAHAIADTADHGKFADRIGRFEGLLEAAVDWNERTPVGGGPFPIYPGDHSEVPRTPRTTTVMPSREVKGEIRSTEYIHGRPSTESGRRRG